MYTISLVIEDCMIKVAKKIYRTILFAKTELEKCSTGHVTFGDGVTGNVVGKGNINRSNASILNDTKLIEGLSANLISISQLCDQVFVSASLKKSVKCSIKKNVL